MSTNVPLMLGGIIPAVIISVILLVIGVPLIYALFALIIPIVIVSIIDKNQKKHVTHYDVKTHKNFCLKCGMRMGNV